MLSLSSGVALQLVLLLLLLLLLGMDRTAATGHTRVIIIFQMSGHIKGILKFNDGIKRCLQSVWVDSLILSS